MIRRLLAITFTSAFFAISVHSSAFAYTCSQHYTACLGYGNSAAVCSCARSICLKKVGATGDAQAKWNWIPGINACFKK